jgi:hypothetical protein
MTSFKAKAMAFVGFGIFLLGTGHFHGVCAIEQCCSLSFEHSFMTDCMLGRFLVAITLNTTEHASGHEHQDIGA